MPEGMLGNLSLSEIQGPRKDLEEKLAGPNGKMWLNALKKMLRGQQPWGIPPTFDVTTNGRSGEQCIADLEKNNFRVGDYAKQLLRNVKFVATNGTTYKLAVIMGDEFEDDDRTNKNIREVAHARGLADPTVELGPYLREMFSDEDLKKMDLWALILVHEPITDSDGGLNMLGVDRNDDGRWLVACGGNPDFRWDREIGFVFLVPASSK
ncbi:hypothetical protein C4546_00410 [Candidatus Parcubacteria bacterium]|jgi:hypothetical protein|nr:MAG: hypothetical protein C4546_00410 [Candidatus Parcubacteria bacterium]